MSSLLLINLLPRFPLLVKNRLGPFHITIKRNDLGDYRCSCCNGWTGNKSCFRKMENWSVNRILEDLSNCNASKLGFVASLILTTATSEIPLFEKDFK